MLNYPRWLIPVVALVVTVTISACAHFPRPHDRWIRFDPATQRYSIDAKAVTRGALLDQLAALSRAEVRPQPERDALVTAHARGLDLEALVALLLPPGVHPTIRAGDADIPGAARSPAGGKLGPAQRPEPGAPAKPDTAADVRPALQPGGTYKQAADLQSAPRPGTGPAVKAPADTLLAAPKGPRSKEARAAAPALSTVRLTLQFEEGRAPRLIAANPIEGRVPVQHFVVGTFVYAVLGPDGRLLQAGTFNDPLVERSYQERGPHQVLRAKTGVVGISVLREHLDGARIEIVDMTGIALPRELTADVVRGALAKGRTVLQLDSGTILRQLDKENKK